MIGLIAQMLGCLIVAAGIGAIAGWLIRHQTAVNHDHEVVDREAELRVKGQALDTALYESKLKSSAISSLEAKVATMESLARSTQQDLHTKQDRIAALQEEMSASLKRLSEVESELTSSLCSLAEKEGLLDAFANEARLANAARTAAQQDLTLKQQEIAELQRIMAASEQGPAELARLQERIATLEPAQGRVHWLEVQLSEKESRLKSAQQQLHELQLQADSREHHVAELERRVADLESVQAELAGRAKMIGEQEEEISRLRKRLVEVRAALRIRADGGHVIARPEAPENQLSLQINQVKPAAASRKDDLKKIHGIGPILERALNKAGTYTYVQIAKWTPSDVASIAEKIGTSPDRIRRDNWIAGAKKQHREKYGEKL